MGKTIYSLKNPSWKNFREIKSRFNRHEKLISRNLFCICTVQCRNYKYSLSHFFGETFVKATVLLKMLLKSWFHGIFFQSEIRDNFSFFHSVIWRNHKMHTVEIRENYSLTLQKFRKNDVFTKYCVFQHLWNVEKGTSYAVFSSNQRIF